MQFVDNSGIAGILSIIDSTLLAAEEAKIAVVS